jgi:putative ABC transport system ATP-binding protein
MSGPALHAADVRKVYGSGDADIVAIDHATLTVDAGEIVALLGPSGSGKTTLLSIAGGLLTATEGTRGGRWSRHHRLLPEATHRVPPRSKVGFVFQSVNLVPFLTAEENLLVVDEFGGSQGAASRRRHGRAELLEELGLGSRVPATCRRS